MLEMDKKTAKRDQSMVHGNMDLQNMDDKKETAYQKILSTLHFEQDNHSSPFTTPFVRDDSGWSEEFSSAKNVDKGKDTCPDCYLLNLQLNRIAEEKAKRLSEVSISKRLMASHRRTMQTKLKGMTTLFLSVRNIFTCM